MAAYSWLPPVDMNRDWGADQRKILEDSSQTDAMVKAALDRGIPQDRIQSFLTSNAGDYGRLKDLTVDGQQAPTPKPINEPLPPPGGGGGGTGGGGTQGGVKPALSGLMGGGGGGGMGAAGLREQETSYGPQFGAMGGLRGLGNRIPPPTNAALAGLKKAY